MAQKQWDVRRRNCGIWRRNYGILHPPCHQEATDGRTAAGCERLQPSALRPWSGWRVGGKPA